MKIEGLKKQCELKEDVFYEDMHKLVGEIADIISEKFTKGTILEFRSFARNELEKIKAGPSLEAAIMEEFDYRVEFMQITELSRPITKDKGEV